MVWKMGLIEIKKYFQNQQTCVDRF